VEPPASRPFVVLLAILAAATAVAVYLVYHKVRISLDPDYVSSCNFGGAMNCDAVNTSDWSELFGLPIALFGIPTYLTWTFLAWRARTGLGAGSGEARQEGRTALDLAALIGLGTVAYSIFLAAISTFAVRAYCIYCITLYLINIAGTWVTLRIGGHGVGRTVANAVRGILAEAPPIRATLAVLALSSVAAWAGHRGVVANMEREFLERVEQQMSEAPVLAESEHAQAGEPAARVSGSESSALESGPAGRRGGKKTDSGWSYFEAPLDEAAEFWAGNPDAHVTLVVYADFQCAYCRRLTRDLDAVKETYGDRIRMTMKHFPMNGACNRVARGYDKHPIACELAYAAHCAGVQGAFWEMHDLLFENQSSLTEASAAEFVAQLGLDVKRFDACIESPETRQKVDADVQSGIYAGFNGTPRLLVNNHLMVGSRSKKVIGYYIDRALAGMDVGAEQVVTEAAPRTPGGTMVALEGAEGRFFIDPYECAIAVDGRAISKPDVQPAYADYFTAQEACQKVGKRLCTEQEWLSACTGEPAVDNDGNGKFFDDALEGNLFPYGAFYVEGACHDDADGRTGTPDPTASREGCRTAAGLYDMTGNIGEWVDGDEGTPVSVGGAMSTSNAECSRRYGTKAKPPHSRNRSTGFRCCADSDVRTDVSDVALLENEETLLDYPAPAIALNDVDGNPVSLDDFDGQVTLINFFASWCSPCRKEFPHLVDYADRYASRGLRVIGVGVDTNESSSIRFAEQFDTNFLVLTDPENRVKGDYLVYTMPATFLVDREGVIRRQFFGFAGPEQEAEFREAIEELL
jgi:protein-disulfide isomerase/uncharacterized membrane protein/peroxiredoxin